MARLPVVGSGVIESLKWLALCLMFAEHWMRYVVGETPEWIFRTGRVVFPLFVFAFAMALRSQPCSKLLKVIVRMFAWAIVAQATLQLVDAPEGQLNVLFTFGLGLTAAYGLGCARPSFGLAIALCAIGVGAHWCEFGIVGVAFVAGAIALARAENPPVIAWLAVAALLAALAIPNGNHFALAAVPVALTVWRLGMGPPRVRGVFYWAYALQFPVFAVARLMLT